VWILSEVKNVARLAISALGLFRVKLDGQSVTNFESAKVRALLAYLAVESDRPHSRDALMALLWPDQPEVAARNNLRHALSNLRQAIGDAAAQPPFLAVTRDCIQFNTGSDYWLDVAEFNALVAACERHTHRHVETCKSCVQRLRQAVELYHGDFLGQFFVNDSPAFEEWVVLERERLRRQALDALHRIAGYLDRRGEYEQALRYATRQLELDPWREEAHRQAMRALALSGQRNAALAQYEMCCRALAEELEVEPAPETTALCEQIKSGSLSAVHGVSQAESSNLPSSTTPFVGRKEELAEIGAILENPACRVVTLIGPGGIGKTRLALAAAAEQVGTFAHGVYFVSLAPLNSADYIVPAIAHAIGFTFSGPQDPKAQLFSYLREKEMLLVLDNFEHLLGGAGLLTEILQHAPGLTLVVTSRERLNLQGEWVFDTQGLSFPQDETTLVAQTDKYSALELFVQGARRIQASFSLSDKDRSCVVRLCRLVAGMPLAIELAAGWMRTLSCDEITLQIEQGLGFLTTSLRDVPERHRSMRTVFDHSWNLLSENERCVFRRLSIFRGGFDKKAAEHVAGASLPVLAALMDKSLVRHAPRSEGRYDLHELLQQYAGEKLSESGELAQVSKRHFEFFLNLAEEIEPKLKSEAQGIWLERLEAEHDNLRAALQWSVKEEGDTALGLRLAGALADFWVTHGHLAEGRQWLEAALERSQGALAPWRAKALQGAGELAYFHGDLAASRSLLEASLAIFRELGSKPGLAYVLYKLAYVTIIQGDLAVTRSLLEESLTIFRALGPAGKPGSAYALQMLGTLANGQGEWMAARAILEESHTIFRELNDQQGIASVAVDLGIVLAELGDCASGRSILEEGMEIAQKLDSEFYVARAAWALGHVARTEGNYALARSWYAEAILLSKELGNVWSIPYVLSAFGSVAAAEEHYERAARLLGAAERLNDAIETPFVPAERARHEHSVAVARAGLGEEGFGVAQAEGWAMTLEQAVVYASE
jgi:predicted ATPase